MKSRKISLFLILLWLIIAGLIVWFKVLPFGKVSYSLKYPIKQNLLGGKGFIGLLTPAERVNTQDNSGAKVFADPVYFSIFTPRTFNEATITFTYEDYLLPETPVIEAGVLVDSVLWRYKLAALENKKLTNFTNWEKTQTSNLTLFQKNKKFTSLNDFLEALKNDPQSVCRAELRECLAFYNLDNTSDYLPLESITEKITPFEEINIPLQGAHQFYFIKPNGQDFSFAFDFVDLNLNRDADNLEINIYQDNNKIYSQKITDDFGFEEGGVVRNFSQSFLWKPEDQKIYLYRLEIKASDDIVIKKIKEAPGALNVINKIRPLENGLAPLIFYTDSNFIQIAANDPANLQTVIFGAKTFKLSEAYRQFEFANEESGLKMVKLEKGDVILETNGIFSFSANSFYNFNFKNIDRHFVLNNNLEFVLADYSGPRTLGNNLKQASVTLNTKEAYREKGKYNFVLSVPGLSLVNDGYIIIKEIKVDFKGRTVFDKIKEFLGFYED